MPRPEPKPHPVFGLISPSEYGRARAALVSNGVPNPNSVVGNSHGELEKVEVARRIIAL